jgi:uroporphyrinogen-III decarboxylase
MIAKLAFSDTTTAQRLLKVLPRDDDQRNRQTYSFAAKYLVQAMAKNDPAGALALARTITDPISRATALVDSAPFQTPDKTKEACREAADSGAAITWFEDQPPTPDPNHHLVTEKTDLLKLHAPDPLGGGRMHDRGKGTALLRERAGDDLAVVGWVEGPIAEAADLRGINTVMLDLVDDPAFVTDMFDFIIPMEIAFAKAQIEAGADIIGIGDAAASLVGPTFYREYVFPYEKQLVDAIHEAGALVRLHICGNIDHLLDDIARLRVDTIDIDFLTNLSLAKEKLGSMPILGNMEPVGCLQNGTPDQIKSVLADCHKTIGEHFIIGAGCEVPPGTPYENLRAMVEYSFEHEQKV